MKQFFYYFSIAAVFVLIGWFANSAYHLPRKPGNIVSEIKQYPLEKYSFDNLSRWVVPEYQLEVGNLVKDYPKFTSNEFSLTFEPATAKGQKKKITGLINIPKGEGTFPVIVMFRGYVDQKLYVTGMGTQHGGEFFASNGYITIAPDFLGYAGSDTEAGDIFESRFQTYTTALATLKAAENIQNGNGKVSIWGHSNGGQIALAMLEITEKPYTTVLWAPNSAKFPYSILYYLDEASDEGKLIITKLSSFMSDYDVTKYSIQSYLGRINKETKIQLHQGTADEAVPFVWNDALNTKIKKEGVDISYIKHAGANHNLTPGWDTAILQSLEFFNSN